MQIWIWFNLWKSEKVYNLKYVTGIKSMKCIWNQKGIGHCYGIRSLQNIFIPRLVCYNYFQALKASCLRELLKKHFLMPYFSDFWRCLFWWLHCFWNNETLLRKWIKRKTCTCFRILKNPHKGYTNTFHAFEIIDQCYRFSMKKVEIPNEVVPFTFMFYCMCQFV